MPEPTFRDLCDEIQLQCPALPRSKIRREVARFLTKQRTGEGRGPAEWRRDWSRVGSDGHRTLYDLTGSLAARLALAYDRLTDEEKRDYERRNHNARRHGHNR